MAILVDGERKKSKIFLTDDGHAFNIEKKKGDVFYVTCFIKGCNVRGKIKLNVVEDEEVYGDVELSVHKNVHNHAENREYSQVIELRRQILEACENSGNSMRQIFDNECSKFPISVHTKLSFYSLKASMYRARQRNYPPVPDNLDELAAIIRNNMERFGKIHGEPFFNNVLGDGKILLFVIPQLIHLGVNSAELHLDGTFKCIPRKPKARQLFILMSVYKDHVSSNFMAFVFLTEEPDN